MSLLLVSSDHSLGNSILNLDTDIYKKVEQKQENGTYLTRKTEEINLKEPVSIFAIAKKYDLKQLVLVESEFSSYWKFYKACKEFGIQGIFGIKMRVVNRQPDDDNETDSAVIVFFKNSQAYYDMVPIYTKMATTKNREITWDDLLAGWTDNLEMAFPFYSSFVARNLMKYNHNALPPNLDKIKPTFFVQKQDLPFDEMLLEGTKKWVAANDSQILEAHQCYYYKELDILKHLTLKCLCKIPRGKWESPNLQFFSSRSFSFQTYCNRNGINFTSN